jgi:nucleotide-binding universal stress UspA family protein
VNANPDGRTQPVLVGVDGKEAAAQAAEFAWHEARRDGRDLVLVTAYVPEVPTKPTMARWAFEAARLGAERRLRQVVADLHQRHGTDVRIEAKTVDGRTKPVLLQQAQSASMIALGRQHLHGLGRAIVGSTSLAVAAQSPCPVIVVPTAWKPASPSHIMVGVDGSRHSIEALRFAYQYASHCGASIIALHAWTAVDYYVNISEGDDIVSAWQHNADLALAESLAGWAAEFPDVTVSRVIDKRHPVESLVEYSGSADLLVVGTSGRHGPAPIAIGSVTRHVMADAVCPVAVVRHHRHQVVHEVDLQAPGVRRQTSDSRSQATH